MYIRFHLDNESRIFRRSAFYIINYAISSGNISRHHIFISFVTFVVSYFNPVFRGRITRRFYMWVLSDTDRQTTLLIALFCIGMSLLSARHLLGYQISYFSCK